MAQNQTLQHKRSTVPGAVPAPSAIAVGELAINFADKALYTKNTANQVVELASDIVKSATAPVSPAVGDLWYDTTNLELKFWNGARWLNIALSGKPVLPGNTTAPPAFTGAGTLASPFTITITAIPGATIDLGVFTITGLAPKQLVPITDINSVANGNRFVVTNNIANDSGVLSFRLIFEDYPVSTAGSPYVADIQVGTGTVYVEVNLSIVNPIPPFPQTINSPTNTLPATTQWTSANAVLTSTSPLQISVDGITYGAGPLSIVTGATLYTRWDGTPGSGIGIDGADGTTITGTISTSAGSVSPTYSLAIDKIPAAFAFSPITGVGLNTLVDSSIVTITGVNSYVYLTSSTALNLPEGATINGGAFASVPTTGTSIVVLSGQTIRIRQTSSGTINTTTTVIISANGVTSPFSITTGNNIVDTPAITTPVDGSTGVAVNAPIVASAYSFTGAVGTHESSDWEIYNNAALTGPTVAQSLASTTNLTSWTPSGLAHLTQYWVRVRYRSNDATPIVSEWSLVIDWTTIARVVNTPSITTPVNNEVNVSTTAQIVASAYSITGPAGTHLNSDWEIYGDIGLTTLVTSSLASTTNLTTWTPTGLVNAVQYWVRVRYRSNAAIVSDWSTAVTWTTIARTITTPTITAPINGSTGILLTAQIVASAYTVTGPVGTHLNSDWQISTDSGFVTIVDSSLASTTNLTTWTPSGLLASTQYWVRVRYRSNDGVVSSYSTPVSWTTITKSVNTPTITVPVNGATGVSTTAQIVASAYSVTGPTGTHLNSDWQISTDASFATIVRSSLASTTNLTTWTPSALVSLTQYWVRVRYRSSDSVVSDYSTPVSWTTNVPLGVNWTNRTSLSNTAWGTTDSVTSITIGYTPNKTFVVCGMNGKIATSPDGITWTNQTGLSNTAWGTALVYNIATNGSLYVVCGVGGRIATSPDGITWTNQTGLSSTAWGTADVYSISNNGATFMVGGEFGQIATSTDGVNWTNRTSLRTTAWGTTDIVTTLFPYTSTVGGFYAAGTNGKFARSSDNGITWTNITTLSATTWGTTQATVISGAGIFGNPLIVAGMNGQIARSTDYGVTWTYQPGLRSTAWGTTSHVFALWYDNGPDKQFIAGGQGGKIARSPDGITWTYETGLMNTAWGTATVNELIVDPSIPQVVAVGQFGKTATSP